MSNTHTLFWWCYPEKCADSPVCLARSFKRCKSTDALSSFFGAPPLALSSTLSLLRAHSSTCFPPQHSHALPAVARALARSLRHSLQLFTSQLSGTGFSPAIGSFLLALPLHHSLTGLSQFQCPAHSAAHSDRSSRPHHESFMNQCLFSALIGECWVQTSDSLQGGSSIIGLPTENRTSWPDVKSFLSDYSHSISCSIF